MRSLSAMLISTLLTGCMCGNGSTLRVGGTSADAGPRDAGEAVWSPAVADAGSLPVLEACGNHLDDDGDGLVDEDCSCTVGETRSCFGGQPAQSGVGSCRAGEQLCEGDEFGSWSTCSAPMPSAEVCNGVDDNCDGQIDENISRACSSSCGAGTELCAAGVFGVCTAPAPTTEVCNGVDDDCDGQVDENITRSCASMCGVGSQTCSAGNWGGCSARTPTAEICGNGVDENCDGVDDRCVCIRTVGATAWQIHQGEAPTCWPQTFPSNGHTGEYQYSTIPSANDPGWAAHASPNISFDTRSTMCGANGAPDLCACRAGGDFTYFQTSFDLPSGYQLTSAVVTIGDVDDGVRVTVFNANYPSGVAGGYAFLGGGTTANLAQYLVSGPNRIVLTHVDDCCQVRRIANASISLNGTAVVACP